MASKHLDDRQHAVVIGWAAPSQFLQPLDRQDRNSRLSAVEPLPAEDLPLWEKLQTALAALAGCMKSRPDRPLGSATDFHRRIADSLKDVGDALRAVGLQDCMDDWDCPRGHGSYARNLLQFTRDPTPEVVGRLLSQNATEPAFFDLMQRCVVQFAEDLLAATKPPSGSLLNPNWAAAVPQEPSAADINAAIEQAGIGPFLDNLDTDITRALASQPPRPVPEKLRQIAGAGPVTAAHVMQYLTLVCGIPPSEQIHMTDRQKYALLEAGVQLERSTGASTNSPVGLAATTVIAAIKPIIAVLEGGPDGERAWVSAYARALTAARDLMHPSDRRDDWAVLADSRPEAQIAMDRLHDLLGDLRFPAAFRPARRADKLAALTSIVKDLEGVAQAAMPADLTTDADSEQDRKGKRINEKMLGRIQREPDSLYWSAQQWADALGCSKSTIAETQTWKTTIRAAKARERAEREMRQERNQGRSDDG